MSVTTRAMFDKYYLRVYMWSSFVVTGNSGEWRVVQSVVRTLACAFLYTGRLFKIKIVLRDQKVLERLFAKFGI